MMCACVCVDRISYFLHDRERRSLEVSEWMQGMREVNLHLKWNFKKKMKVFFFGGTVSSWIIWQMWKFKNNWLFHEKLRMQIRNAWLFLDGKHVIRMQESFHASHESILKRDWTFSFKKNVWKELLSSWK